MCVYLRKIVFEACVIPSQAYTDHKFHKGPELEIEYRLLCRNGDKVSRWRQNIENYMIFKSNRRLDDYGEY